MAEQASDLLICPDCQHQNQAGVAKCANCGRQLVHTIPVPDEVATIAQRTVTRTLPDAESVALMADTLAFIIPGFSEPLLIERSDEMILGRQAPNEPAPEVDLTIYNAYALGVSRRHAVMRCTKLGCTIEDLGSANSTWVNENRLQPRKPWPLRSGDQIRMGHLAMFVYFKSLISLFLVDTGSLPALRRKLTPYFLANHVSPYLRALADIQVIIDDILGRTPSEVVIHTLSVSSGNVINIRLEKVADAINLVNEQVIPWKRAYIDADKPAQETAQFVTQEADKVPALADMEATTEAGQETASGAAQAAAQAAESETVRETAQNTAQNKPQKSAQEVVRNMALKRLIDDILVKLSPRLSDQDKAAYAGKLSAAVSVLVESTLEPHDQLSNAMD